MLPKKSFIIYLSLILNLCLFLILTYLFFFTTKGQFLLNRASSHPRTLNWTIEVQKHLLYAQNTKDKPIIMLGNSITYECAWGEIMDRNDIVNRGIPGDNILGMLERSTELLETQPKTIVIMAGINDILNGKTSKEVASKFIELINICAIKTNTIVISTLYTSNNIRANEEVQLLNKTVKDYCYQKKILWLDLNHRLAKGKKLQSKYTYDGVHLNGSAYLIWAEILRFHLPPVSNHKTILKEEISTNQSTKTLHE